MASTALNDLKKLTPSNQAIQDLRELIFLSTLQYGSLAETLTFQYGAKNGKYVGGIGEFDIIGESKKLCKPTFNSTKIATQEKKWELGAFVVSESLCADDFAETVARFCMNTGTRKADLTDTDLLAHIVEPRLKTAIEKGLWRYYWFGDKTAKNVSAQGIITDGVDTKHFTAVDGLFKRLYDITATNASRRIKIDANGEASKALQRSKLFEDGVATGIFDDLIYGANIKLRQQTDKVVLCTQSYADALASDVKKTNKGSDLQWESLFDGLVSATKYNGETILALPIWDEMIASYEDQGDTLKFPHRVLYASKSALWGGVESENDFMPNLDIWFSKDDQENKILGREEVGTLIWEDDLVQFAY